MPAACLERLSSKVFSSQIAREADAKGVVIAMTEGIKIFTAIQRSLLGMPDDDK